MAAFSYDHSLHYEKQLGGADRVHQIPYLPVSVDRYYT